MKRRPPPEQEAPFRPSDVYKLALYGRAEYVRRWGRPSRELEEALEEHRRRMPSPLSNPDGN